MKARVVVVLSWEEAAAVRDLVDALCSVVPEARSSAVGKAHTKVVDSMRRMLRKRWVGEPAKAPT